MSNNQMNNLAQGYVALSNEYARKASASWEKGRDLWNFINRQSDRLKNWKSIMSTAPVLALNAAFIPVCIAEYYFSKEIYRNINEEAPWSIALGFIAIGIVISEMLVYLTYKQKQNLKFYELRHQDETKKDEPDDILHRSVRQYSIQMFIIGCILAVAIIGLLYYFSDYRVKSEISADIRAKDDKENPIPFGVQDLMPVGLYFFEIITGSFIWYSLRKTVLWIQIKISENRLAKAKNECISLMELVKNKYQDAVEKGYLWHSETSKENEISEAFYALSQRNTSDNKTYFEEPIRKELIATLRITRNNVPFNCDVDVLTAFKKRERGVLSPTNTGEYTIKVNTFENDKLVNVRLTANNPETGQPETKEFVREMSFSNDVHVIDWG